MNKQKDSSNSLYSPDDALLYGTAFKTLYEPYKNYKKASVKLSSEKERAMYEVQKYAIMCHDLALYLDVYPNDTGAIALRKQYLKLWEEAKKAYVDKYPPFDVNCEKNNVTPYPWSTTNFPWGDK